jgi:archaellum component FlaC
VFGRADSSKGRAVEGLATAASGPTRGVRGFAESDSGIGVLGIGDTGVVGRSNTGGDAVVAQGDAKVTEFLDVAQVGTRDDTALELDVNGQRALRIEPTFLGTPSTANIVGGNPFNSAASGVEGATIAGGGFDDRTYQVPNTVEGNYGTVGGGIDNTASGLIATVPGGAGNTASGEYSFAAGRNAKAEHDGAFVFGDKSSTQIKSNSADEVRSQMPMYAPSFNTTSARAKKTAVESVNAPDVLERVEDLDVNTWELDHQDDGRHMGPMAGEFADAFELGDDNEHIATVDADGVALAAIQGLATRLNEKDERIVELEAEAETVRDEAETAREEAATAREENAEQADTIDELKAENEELREQTRELAARLEAVENQLDPVAAD